MTPQELLDTLGAAVGHARELGLAEGADRADRTLSRIEDRIGFTGDAYVLALGGGTGVGKSTLLNAIAGTEVTDVSVIRPTTQRPLAWVAEGAVDETGPLLQWLEVDKVVEHGKDTLDGVVIIDLPDFDSIVTEHRATFDRLLPRIDSLWWVVDPQKYDDERLFVYLRALGSRVDAVHVVLNKIDLLAETELVDVIADLERRLGSVNLGRASVHPVSAATGTGISELVSAVESGVEAKRVVIEKIRADVVSEVDTLAAAAGVGRGEDTLLTDDQRADYVEAVADGAVGVADPAGISRQVTAAYLERASSVAGSILGRLGLLVRMLTGSRRRNADPAGYMRRWRSRGDLSQAVTGLRRAYLDATADLPAAARAGLLIELDPETARESVTDALDDALTTTADELDIRTPWWWRVMAVLQLIATAGVIVAMAWFLTLWLTTVELPVGTVDVPYLGPVPVPLVLLAGGAVLSFLIGAIVRIHASLRGRRYARRVTETVRARVSSAVEETGFGPLTVIEGHRQELARLSVSVSRAYGPTN